MKDFWHNDKAKNAPTLSTWRQLCHKDKKNENPSFKRRTMFFQLFLRHLIGNNLRGADKVFKIKNRVIFSAKGFAPQYCGSIFYRATSPSPYHSRHHTAISP